MTATVTLRTAPESTTSLFVTRPLHVDLSATWTRPLALFHRLQLMMSSNMPVFTYPLSQSPIFIFEQVPRLALRTSGPQHRGSKTRHLHSTSGLIVNHPPLNPCLRNPSLGREEV